MSYQIPEEILNLYQDMEKAFAESFDSNDHEKANFINQQMGNTARNELSNAVEERKRMREVKS